MVWEDGIEAFPAKQMSETDMNGVKVYGESSFQDVVHGHCGKKLQATLKRKFTVEALKQGHPFIYDPCSYMGCKAENCEMHGFHNITKFFVTSLDA